MRSIYFTEKKRERLKGRTDEAERLLTGPCRTKNDGGIAQLARAPALQAGGQRFESVYLHHEKQQLFNNGLRNNEPNQYGLIAQPVRAHA